MAVHAARGLWWSHAVSPNRKSLSSNRRGTLSLKLLCWNSGVVSLLDGTVPRGYLNLGLQFLTWSNHFLRGHHHHLKVLRVKGCWLFVLGWHVVNSSTAACLIIHVISNFAAVNWLRWEQVVPVRLVVHLRLFVLPVMRRVQTWVGLSLASLPLIKWLQGS